MWLFLTGVVVVLVLAWVWCRVVRVLRGELAVAHRRETELSRALEAAWVQEREARRFVEEFQRRREKGVLEVFGNTVRDFPEWTVEDAERFRGFLGTETGRKFLQALQAVEQERNRAAVRAVPYSEEAVGTARGWGKCLEWIVELSVVDRPDQVQNDAQGPKDHADGLRERLT